MPDKLTILITGCSTGIGRATAERLAAGGHTVYATARKLEAVADLEGKGCRTLALDVTDEASMEAAVARIDEESGGVDALVNNAGYSQSGAVETLAMDALRRQFETNVFGLVRLTQLVLPGMRERGFGRIVNISSMGANFTFPGGGAYHATKYAVEAHLRRAPLRGRGVRHRRGRGPAGGDPDRVRQGGDRLAREPRGLRRRLRRVQPQGRPGDAGGLREGPVEAAGRRSRRRRQGDREGDHRRNGRGRATT